MQEHVGNLLYEYVDEELKNEERDVVEKHLNVCPECRKQLSELISLREQLTQAYQSIEIPDLIEDKIMIRIQQDSIKSGILNRTAIIMMIFFGIILLAAATPFLTVGIHIFQTLFSIGRGLIYAIPSIIAAIPYVVEVVALFILLLIALALVIIRYFVHTMGKTVGAEDI